MKQTVYIASPKSQQIHVWYLNTEGFLTLMQVVYIPEQVQPMVISFDKRFLYIGVRPEFRVLAYYISPKDGTLTWAAEAPLPDSPTHISIDHHGKFLFSSSYHGGCVSVMRLENGIPREIVDTIKGLEGCHSANISPNNQTLWVLALKQDRIYLFTLSNDGKLEVQTPEEITTIKGAGPRHMVFHPNQQYAYVVNELISSVDVWQLKDSNMDIMCIQTLDMMPINFSDTRWAADIHITPDGRHLYACDRTASLITIFSVSENGRVLTVEGFQSTETQPRGFNIDHSGKYLIAAGQKSHHISLYEIYGAQGFLKKKGRYTVGLEPMWVVINAY